MNRDDVFERMFEAVFHLPRPPCATCTSRHRCASEELACYDFSMYVHNRPYSLDNTQRMPSRGRYRVLFKEDDL